MTFGTDIYESLRINYINIGCLMTFYLVILSLQHFNFQYFMAKYLQCYHTIIQNEVGNHIKHYLLNVSMVTLPF